MEQNCEKLINDLFVRIKKIADEYFLPVSFIRIDEETVYLEKINGDGSDNDEYDFPLKLAFSDNKEEIELYFKENRMQEEFWKMVNYKHGCIKNNINSIYKHYYIIKYNSYLHTEIGLKVLKNDSINEIEKLKNHKYFNRFDTLPQTKKFLKWLDENETELSQWKINN